MAARWIRGFLPLGILAAPGHHRLVLPGDGTYANDDVWIAFCTKHERTIPVGDLTPHTKAWPCEEGHQVKSRMLRECVACDAILAFDKNPGAPKCHKHGGEPVLEGTVDDKASAYKPPET